MRKFTYLEFVDVAVVEAVVVGSVAVDLVGSYFQLEDHSEQTKTIN